MSDTPPNHPREPEPELFPCVSPSHPEQGDTASLNRAEATALLGIQYRACIERYYNEPYRMSCMTCRIYHDFIDELEELLTYDA